MVVSNTTNVVKILFPMESFYTYLLIQVYERPVLVQWLWCAFVIVGAIATSHTAMVFFFSFIFVAGLQSHKK